MPLRVRARQVLRSAGFAGATAALGAGYVIRAAVAGRGQQDAVRDRWVGRWSAALLSLFHIELVVASDVPPPLPGRGRLIVANHRSPADIGIILKVFGGRMVGRADLARVPVLGQAARAVGTVFVDRSDAKSGAVAIREVRDLLKAGATVAVFPEGTIFPGDEVHPFKPGGFVAALHSGADLVPVGLAYAPIIEGAKRGESFFTHLGRMAAAKGSRVAVRIGTPIEVTKDARAGTLAERSHAAVNALVAEARALLDA